MELETNDTELSTASFERELSLVVAITLLFISLGSIVANAMLLSAIYNDHYKCFRSPPIYFIANLAFADLLTGIFVDSLYAVYDLGFYLDKEYLIILTVGDYASYITVNNAVCTIIFLSIDRSIAIKKPFFYRRNITAKTVAVIIAVSWMYSVFFSTFRLMGMADLPYIMLDTYLHDIFAFLTLSCLFAFIYHNLKQEKRTNLKTFDATVSVESTAEQRLREIKSDKRLLVTIFLILFVFFLCFAPYAVFVHLHFFCEPCKSSKVYYFLSKASEPIIYLNSVLNPFIYAWRHKNFRKALLWIVRCRNRPSKHQTRGGQTTSSKGNTNSVEVDVQA